MRRPTLCSGAVAPVPGPTDDCYSTEKDTESRLARVKRMLSGTLLAGRRGRTFGLRLEELPAGADGVPKILVRLCAYIELHGMRCGGLFRLSAGNPKLVERLRASFDRTGDADLESAGDAATVASLLKLWIRDLPEPLITASVVTELVAVHEKLHDEPAQWRESVAHTLRGLPDPNSRVLCFLLRFLFRYDQHLHNAQCHHHTAGGVAAIFSPLLLHRAMDIHTLQQTMTTQIMNKLIHECHYIFSERLVDHAIQVAVGGGDLRLFAAGSTGTTQNQQKQTNAVIVAELANTHKQQQQRKRKERHESFNSQTQERKVIRSNSEERPLEEGNTNNKDSIRRVSSHEDFSLVKGNSKNNKDINKHKKSFLSELIDPAMGHGVRASGLPLHERNLPTTGAYSSNTYGKPHVSGTTESETAVLQDNELFDDNEHERRRSTERFARAVAPRGRRNMARRRRTVHKAVKSSPEDNDGGGSSKENEDQEEITSRSHHQAPPPPPPTTLNSSEDEGVSSRSSSAHSFMQLHPQVARIERERSPSPVPSPCTPPLDLSTLHEQVDCSEPLTSHASWNLEGDEQEKMIANSRVMLSPRNSMILTRRVYLDPNVPPSPPQEHDVPSSHGVADAKIKQLSKQVHSMKKKLKKFEEEFELSHGYHPSHADKMANKEIKKLCTELNKFRKELKQLKENPSEVLLPGVGHSSSEDKLLSSKPATMEEIVQEVEKILRDKREATGRPEALDELTREQLLDEKVAMQKSLLHLEDAFGRPVTKSDRDLVRPLYDRYRLLKRMIIRTAPSKMKDSISELATIHEHETMDFTSSPSSLTGQEEMVTSEPHATEINGDSTLVSQMQLSGSSENLMENLHAMPLSELLSQQRSLREEKKCLRRTLREFEEDFQRRMGRKLQREDRIPMEGVYTSYKQAKAKLRLLEALVTKQT